MSDETRRQDLLSLWQHSMEEGIKAWRDLLGLQEGKGPPEVLGQWKRLMDETVETWSALFAAAMGTEAFAAAMGKCLDEYLNTVAPVRKSLQASGEEFLRAMNLPSRTQVTGLASQIVTLDARLEAIEDRIEELHGTLTSPRPARAKDGPSRTNAGRASKQGKGPERSTRRTM